MNTFANMHRLSHALWLRGHPHLAVAVRNVSQIVHGGFIGVEAEIDPSVRFFHNGLGVVIHGTARIGAGSVVLQGVTLGVKNPLGGGVLPWWVKTRSYALARRLLVRFKWAPARWWAPARLLPAMCLMARRLSATQQGCSIEQRMREEQMMRPSNNGYGIVWPSFMWARLSNMVRLQGSGINAMDCVAAKSVPFHLCSPHRKEFFR